MVINESTKLAGYIVGIGINHADSTEEFTWLETPKHNRITSVGLDHLLCCEGNVSGGYTKTDSNALTALWLGQINASNTRYGALHFCKIGTGSKATSFEDTDLQNPVTSYTSTLRTGEPFTGTKVINDGEYQLRVTHVAEKVTTDTIIKEVGLFGRYGSGDDIVYPMFARIVLDSPIKLSAGDALTFTYELHVQLASVTAETGTFMDLLDDVGEPLNYEKKLYFKYIKNDNKIYQDILLKNPYIVNNGTELNSSSTLGDDLYFANPPVYYYHNYNYNGAYDSIGYSTDPVTYTVQDQRLSKAKAESGDYKFDFCDYEGVGNNDKHRDIKITMGIYNPKIEDPMGYVDIKFLRIRGMDYRFGYYDPETTEWVSQSLRKWANQTMTFTIRTRYVTDDTVQLIPEETEPDIKEETP